MPKQTFIRTSHEWLQTLEDKSEVAKRLTLSGSEPQDFYSIEGSKHYQNVDAFNLASNDQHNFLIAETLDQLSTRGTSDQQLKDLLVNLTRNNTYGTFAELMGYRAMLASGRDFEVQVAFSGSDILNPNGADLDGTIDLEGQVAFDIKAFGFTEHLLNKVVSRLKIDFPANNIATSIEGAVSIKGLKKLAENYNNLRSELATVGRSSGEGVLIEARQPAGVQFTENVLDPIAIAKENSTYAFNYAKQYTRHVPFILTFVIHPWSSGLTLTLPWQDMGRDLLPLLCPFMS